MAIKGKHINLAKTSTVHGGLGVANEAEGKEDDRLRTYELAKILDTLNVIPNAVGYESFFNPVDTGDKVDILTQDVIQYELETGEVLQVELGVNALIINGNVYEVPYQLGNTVANVLFEGNELSVGTTKSQVAQDNGQLAGLTDNNGELLFSTQAASLTSSVTRNPMLEDFSSKPLIKTGVAVNDVVLDYGASYYTYKTLPTQPVDLITAGRSVQVTKVLSLKDFRAAYPDVTFISQLVKGYAPVVFKTPIEFSDYFKVIDDVFPALLRASVLDLEGLVIASEDYGRVLFYNEARYYNIGANTLASLPRPKAGLNYLRVEDPYNYTPTGAALIIADQGTDFEGGEVQGSYHTQINTDQFSSTDTPTDLLLDFANTTGEFVRVFVTPRVYYEYEVFFVVDGITQVAKLDTTQATYDTYYILPKPKNTLGMFLRGNDSSTLVVTDIIAEVVDFPTAKVLATPQAFTEDYYPIPVELSYYTYGYLSAKALEVSIGNVEAYTQLPTTFNIVTVPVGFGVPYANNPYEPYDTTLALTNGAKDPRLVRHRSPSQLFPVVAGLTDTDTYATQYGWNYGAYQLEYLVYGVMNDAVLYSMALSYKAFDTVIVPYNALKQTTRDFFKQQEVHNSWFTATVKGELYAYIQGLGGILHISKVDGSVTLHNPDFLNMPYIRGLSSAAGRLIVWDSTDSIFRSSVYDPLDFTPALKTQSTVHKVKGMLGSIMQILNLGDSYVVYATGSIHLATFNPNNSEFRYTLLTDNMGVFHTDSVVRIDLNTHMAFTNVGLVQINANGVTPVDTQFSEYMLSSRLPVTLKYLAGRYLAISGEPTGNKLLTYTSGIGKGATAIDPTQLDLVSYASTVTIIPAIPPTSRVIAAVDALTQDVVVQDIYPIDVQVAATKGYWVYYQTDLVPRYRDGTVAESFQAAMNKAPPLGSVLGKNPSMFNPDVIGYDLVNTGYVVVPYDEIMTVFAEQQAVWLKQLMAYIKRGFIRPELFHCGTSNIYDFGGNILNGQTYQLPNPPKAGVYFQENTGYLTWGGFAGDQYSRGTSRSITGFTTVAAYIQTLDQAQEALATLESLNTVPTHDYQSPNYTIQDAFPVDANGNVLYTVTVDGVSMQLTLAQIDALPLTRTGSHTVQVTTEGFPSITVNVDGSPEIVIVTRTPSVNSLTVPSVGVTYAGTEFIGKRGGLSSIPTVINKTHILDLETKRWGSCDIPVRQLLSLSPKNDKALVNALRNDPMQVSYASGLRDIYGIDWLGRVVRFDTDQVKSLITLGRIGLYSGHRTTLYDLTPDNALGEPIQASVQASIDGSGADIGQRKNTIKATGTLPVHTSGSWFSVTLIGKFLLKGLNYRTTKGGLR